MTSKPNEHIDTVEIQYDLSKYEKKIESWNQDITSPVERYFNIYEAKAKPNSQFSNQMIYQSPSSISLIMLHETHPFLTLKSQLSSVKSIELDINKNILDNPAIGKRKKGAYKLEPDTILVTIQVKLEKEGKIEELNFPIGANLYGTIIEINKKIIEKPELLFDKYNTEAYIAIILPTLAKSPINDPPVEMVGKNRKEKEEKENNEEDTNDNSNLIEIKSSKLSKYDKRRVKYNQQLIKDAENINHPLITLKIPIFVFEGQSLDEE